MRGRKGKKEIKTYFLVVGSPALLAIRKKISKLFVEKGGQAKDFVADNFFPHVTIGFTQRDLFESDGVVKDATSCILPLP